MTAEDGMQSACVDPWRWRAAYTVDSARAALKELGKLVARVKEEAALSDAERRWWRFHLERTARWATYVLRCVRDGAEPSPELEALEEERRCFVAQVAQVVAALSERREP